MQLERRFLTLDAMRGVAAIVVVLIHMGGAPAKALSGGYLAVDFFFVLSGFVLAHAYEDRQLGFSSFAKARMVRLYPLYFAGLLLGFGVATATGTPILRVLTPLGFGLFFLPTPGASDLYPLNPPAWSLLFELVANAAWFPLRRWLRGRVGFGALVLSGCGLLAADAVFGAVYAGGNWGSLWGGLARVTFSFLAGVLTYRVWCRGGPKLRVPSWAAVSILVAVLAAPAAREVFDPVAVLLMPLIVYLGAGCEPVGVANRAAQRGLGDASFGIYALHFPIIVAIDGLLIGSLRGAGISHPSLVTTPLTLILVVGSVLVLDRIYDRPIRHWLSQIGKPRQALAETLAAP